MDSYSLATAKPEDQARAKARLLYEALQQIASSGAELDLSSGLNAILARVTRAFGLSQRDPLYTAKAQAIAIVTINLGLEYATGGDLNKAVNALTRNPIEAIYAIGEKISTELRDRVIQVQADAFVTIRRDSCASTYYGVTDSQTETQLSNWVTKGLSEHQFLPISSMVEINAIKAVLERVMLETALAKKIDWSHVLGEQTEEARFSAKLFARVRKDTYSIRGGVWKPFLLSIIMQAMTEGWIRNKNQLAFVDRFAVIEFLDLVNNHFDEISGRANLAIYRITQVATRKYGDVVRISYTPNEIEDIFSFAQSCLYELSQQARDFYAEKTDAEILNAEVIDRFWRDRILLSSTVPYDVRIAESGAAWEKLSQMKTLTALTHLVKGFQHWPIAEQERFSAIIDLNSMLDAIGSPSDQSKALYELWQALGPVEKTIGTARSIILNCINWTKRTNLLVALYDGADYRHYANAITEGAGLADWNFDQILSLQKNNAGRAFLEIALRCVSTTLTQEQWNKIYELASSDCGLSIEQAWNAMGADRQAKDFMKFNARDFAILILNWQWNKVKSFLEPIFVANEKDPEFHKQFRYWYQGGATRNSSFIASDRWKKQFEELCRQYLGWRTSEEQIFDSLPAGHSKRRQFDRRLNEATIAKLATEKPWERLMKIESWDDLCEVLKNFVLWPETEQDGVALSTFRIDSQLDLLLGPDDQVRGITHLEKAMEGPFRNSPYVATVLAEIISWENRHNLALALLVDKQRMRSLTITLTRNVRWPVNLIKQLPNDQELLKQALVSILTPTIDKEWAEFCRGCSNIDLWVAEIAWNKLSDQQKKRFFMHFTAQQISGLIVCLTEDEVYNFFKVILDEQGGDETFKRDFKFWYYGGIRGWTRFLMLDSWKPRLETLFQERLGWVMKNKLETRPKPGKKLVPATNEPAQLLVLNDYLNHQLNQTECAKAQARALIDLWQTAGGKSNHTALNKICELIEWTDRAELIAQLNQVEFEVGDNLLLELAGRAMWPYSATKTIYKSNSRKEHYFDMILIAVENAKPPLTPEDWAHVAGKVGYYNPRFGKRLWALMPNEQRNKLFVKFPGVQISDFYQNEPWEVVRDLFTSIFTETERHTNFVHAFERWFYGGKSPFEKAHAFKPAPAWQHQLDDLFRRSLYGIKPLKKG